MTLKDESGKMAFEFPDFLSESDFDTQTNACAGLKLVDFVAENEEAQFFIEAKNYINQSSNPVIMANMASRQKADYKMLTDPVAAYPLEMGMKFKDSLFRWLASGNDFKKPIVLLLVINPPPGIMARDRERLINKIKGYIPDGLNSKLSQYPRMTRLLFDMPRIEEVEKYGVSVSLLP